MGKPASSPEADYYRFISAMGKQAMKDKEAKGMRMRRPPLGWRMVRINCEPYLEPDPETYPLVAEARRLRAEGKSIRAVLAAMTRKGLRSRSGRPLSVAGMAVVLGAPPTSSGRITGI